MKDLADLRFFLATLLKPLISEAVNESLQSLPSPAQPTPEQLLTREQTAELLQVDLSTLWHWTRKGKLKSYGLGNRVYYRRSEIESSLKPLNGK